MSASQSDTLNRPSTLAKIGDAQPEEGGRWELRVAMTFKTMEDVEIRAMVDFVRIGRQFAGQTMVVYYMGEQGGPRFDADIEGELSDTDIQLDMTLLDGELAGTPYHCTGTAEVAGKRYTGRWHMPCIDPVECGCDGDDGDFSLTRVG